MKKKLINAVLILMIAIPVLFTAGANAATEVVTLISDNFNASALDGDLWETSSQTNAGIKDYGGALQIVNGDFATSVGWKGLRASANSNGIGNGLSGDYTLELTISRDMLPTQWLAVYIGMDDAAKRFNGMQDSDGARGSILVFNSATITHYVGQGVLATASSQVVALGDEDAKANAVSTFNIPELKQMKSDGTRYRLKFVAHFGEEAKYRRYNNKLDVYIAPEPEDMSTGEIDYGDKVATIYYVNVEGYFGFGSMSSGTATISDIKVTDAASGNVLYTPAGGLKTPTVEHIVGSGSSEYKNYEFRVWNTQSGQYSKNYYNGPLGVLLIKDGAEITTKQAVVTDNTRYSLYDVDFTLRAQDLTQGLNVIVAKSTGTAAAVKMETVDGNMLISFGSQSFTEELQGTNKFTLKVKNDGKIAVFINDVQKHTFSGLDIFGGRLGFKALGTDTAAEIDNYSITTYRTAEALTPSAAIDFSLKDGSGTPYLQPDLWYTGGNALKLKGYDEIAFINASSPSMFSTKKAYADYVLKFDITDITQHDPNNIIIFSFAKDEYHTDYKNSPSVIFVSRSYVNDKTEAMNIEALNGMSFTNNSSTARQPDNMFADFSGDTTHSAVNVIIVVQNNTVSIYYKYDDQPQSMLSVPRAVISGVETYGYLGITCGGKSNFSIKNFSIFNISADRSFIGSPSGELTSGDLSIFD